MNCTICGQAFAREVSRRRHEWNIHNVEASKILKRGIKVEGKAEAKGDGKKEPVRMFQRTSTKERQEDGIDNVQGSGEVITHVESISSSTGRISKSSQNNSESSTRSKERTFEKTISLQGGQIPSHETVSLPACSPMEVSPEQSRQPLMYNNYDDTKLASHQPPPWAPWDMDDTDPEAIKERRKELEVIEDEEGDRLDAGLRKFALQKKIIGSQSHASRKSDPTLGATTPPLVDTSGISHTPLSGDSDLTGISCEKSDLDYIAVQMSELVDRLMLCVHDLFSPLETSVQKHGNESTSSITRNQTADPAAERTGRNKKRKVGNEREDDCNDDEQEDGSEKRRKLLKEPNEPILEHGRKLACPYFKKNSQSTQLSRACHGPGWETVHRLK